MLSVKYVGPCTMVRTSTGKSSKANWRHEVSVSPVHTGD